MKPSNKILNGKTRNPQFKKGKKIINTKLNVIDIIRINAFIKLLIKAPFSPFIFAKYEMYTRITP